MNLPKDQPEDPVSEMDESTSAESKTSERKSTDLSTDESEHQEIEHRENDGIDNDGSDNDGSDNDGSDNDGSDSNGSENNVKENESGKTPLYVIIMGVVLTLLVIVCLQVDDWSRDWTTNFAETTEESSDVNLRPVESNLDPSAFADLVVQKMQGANRWSVGKPQEEDDDVIVIDLVHKTLVFGFKDDVRVTITPNETGSRLTATSQSRVGKGDLGQNPRNLRELIARVRSGLSQ